MYVRNLPKRASRRPNTSIDPRPLSTAEQQHHPPTGVRKRARVMCTAYFNFSFNLLKNPFFFFPLPSPLPLVLVESGVPLSLSIML